MAQRHAAEAHMWTSPEAQTLVQRGDVGGLIRLGRAARGWRLSDLGEVVGYSAAALSRFERRPVSLAPLCRVTDAVGIPRHVLAQALGVTGLLPARVGATVGRRAEEDLMRRRQLLAASLAVPAAWYLCVDDALAAIPRTDHPVGDVAAQLARGRGLYDTGAHAQLVQALPDLLANAHGATRPGRPDGYARLAACYDLATDVLIKVSRAGSARTAADRATVYADLSESPLAQASSVRRLSIVLRHQGDRAAAHRLTLDAAGRLEATGLIRRGEAATYAQLLCTCAYNAATAGDRRSAHELIADAERAVDLLPEAPGPRAGGAVDRAAVALYAVGVHWNLGDAGAAIAAGRDLHPGQFPTAERRARLHTDLARAWHLWGKPEQTADALLSAYRESPGDVRDRASIRGIVTDLQQHHPHAAGVRDLVAAVGRAAEM